jgi:hypothetical protein
VGDWLAEEARNEIGAKRLVVSMDWFARSGGLSVRTPKERNLSETVIAKPALDALRTTLECTAVLDANGARLWHDRHFHDGIF